MRTGLFYHLFLSSTARLNPMITAFIPLNDPPQSILKDDDNLRKYIFKKPSRFNVMDCKKILNKNNKIIIKMVIQFQNSRLVTFYFHCLSARGGTNKTENKLPVILQDNTSSSGIDRHLVLPGKWKWKS